MAGYLIGFASGFIAAIIYMALKDFNNPSNGGHAI